MRKNYKKRKETSRERERDRGGGVFADSIKMQMLEKICINMNKK